MEKLILGIFNALTGIFWKGFDLQRKVRFTVHRAVFFKNGNECFFLNVTNLSPSKEIEITHLWFEGERQFAVTQKDRPLPKRLKPDETWETWIKTSEIPLEIRNAPFEKARLRISTGKVLKSKENISVPSSGSVSGGKITQI